jgi:tetratricopeptide (TPR) repeat protein
MNIYELQNSEWDANDEFWLEAVEEKTREWNEKKIDEAHYHSQLSLCYRNLYNPEECKKHAALVPAWAHAQEKTEALVSMARILVYEKRIEDALDYYQQAYALTPDHEVVIEEAGWCCFELKQWEQAQDWFMKGTLLEEDWDLFWGGLGRSLAQQQKYAEALPVFEKALALCDKEYDGYSYLHLIGQCYANLNDFYRALGYYTKSLEANPTYTNALNDIAALYFNQEGDMNNAIDYLKKAEAIAEKDGNDFILQCIYINLARIYGKIKEFELQEHYQAKLLDNLGFGIDDDEEEEDE